MKETPEAGPGSFKGLADVLRAWEQERSRVAGRLYGDVAQRLSTVLLYMEVARKHDELAASRSGAAEALETARAEAEDALREIRRFARELHPPELDELGPAAACEAYARNLAEAHGVSVTVQSDPVDPLLNGDAAVAFYRVLEAALAGAIRKGDAGHLILRIREIGDASVEATLEDDGSGSDLLELLTETTTGGGFVQVADQVIRAAGRVELERRPGGGTSVRVRVPAHAEGAAAGTERRPAGSEGSGGDAED